MITARSVQHVMHIDGREYPMVLRLNEDETWTVFASGQEVTHKDRRQAIVELVARLRSQAPAPEDRSGTSQPADYTGSGHRMHGL